MMSFGYNVGVPPPLAQLHIKHSRRTQFYAPTEVMTVSCQCPTPSFFSLLCL